MSYHLLYETSLGRTRASLFDESGRLLMLRQDDPSRPLIEGAVIWGRVRSITSGMGSAFVDIGDTRDGVLPLSTLPAGSKKLTQGQPILVRVTRGGFGEKGAKLDARVAQDNPPASTPTPKLIKPALPAITRALHDAHTMPVTVWLANPSAMEDAKKHVSTKNIRLLSDPDSPPLLDFLDDAMDAILSPKPTFTFHGGNLIVEITSAVATIDVNSPLTHTRGMSRAESILATNLKAAEEIARISRLLDLGGSIIIDFITPPSKAHRQIVTDHLQASFAAADEGDVEIRPMSRHGLVELNRTRTGPSLNLLQAQAEYVAARILFNLWRTAGTLPVSSRARFGKTVLCHPSIAQILKPLLKDSTCLIALGQTVEVTEEELIQPTLFRIRDRNPD